MSDEPTILSYATPAAVDDTAIHVFDQCVRWAGFAFILGTVVCVIAVGKAFSDRQNSDPENLPIVGVITAVTAAYTGVCYGIGRQLRRRPQSPNVLRVLTIGLAVWFPVGSAVAIYYFVKVDRMISPPRSD